MNSWRIWRKDGFCGVIGPETGRYIDVVSLDEIEPYLKIIREGLERGNGLRGNEFWQALKELVKICGAKSEHSVSG